MITNLLASIVITLVTNVTERVPMRQEPWNQIPNLGVQVQADNRTWPAIGDLGYRVREVPVADPKQKWVRTTVKRFTFLSFKYQDDQYQVGIKEETVSDIEVEFALQRVDKWNPVLTNAVYGSLGWHIDK